MWCGSTIVIRRSQVAGVMEESFTWMLNLQRVVAGSGPQRNSVGLELKSSMRVWPWLANL